MTVAAGCQAGNFTIMRLGHRLVQSLRDSFKDLQSSTCARAAARFQNLRAAELKRQLSKAGTPVLPLCSASAEVAPIVFWPDSLGGNGNLQAHTTALKLANQAAPISATFPARFSRPIQPAPVTLGHTWSQIVTLHGSAHC